MKTTFKAVMAIVVPVIILAACSFNKKEKAKEAKTESTVTETPRPPLSYPAPAAPVAKEKSYEEKEPVAKDGNSSLGFGNYSVSVQSQGTASAVYAVTGGSAGALSFSQSAQDNHEPTTNKPTPRDLTTTAAIENNKDSAHVFLRTADIKCKVNDVAKATYQVEYIIRRMGGYVSYTNLASTVENKNEVPVCADSTLQITHYNIENTMIIRVPNTNLDSTLVAITPLLQHLDYRTVRANDIALQLLANKLHQARVSKYEGRMSSDINQNIKKLADATEAESALLDKQEQADNARIDNLSLTDQVKYSTINLSLYQPPVTETSLVYNDKAIKPYEPPFATQLLEALQLGWSFCVTFFLFLIKLWPLIAFAIIGAVIYGRWKASPEHSKASVS
jgi:hypothetical protein